MEGILDAIFGNFLVILAIVGGVIGFFKNNTGKESDKDSRKPFQTPKPTATPSGGNYGSSRQTTTVETTPNTIRIEEQQEIQMQQLRERMNTNKKQVTDNPPKDMLIGDGITDFKDYESEQKIKMKKQVKNSLKGKRLVDGIIMSEVLGPPRAIKPYRSIISNRRN